MTTVGRGLLIFWGGLLAGVLAACGVEKPKEQPKARPPAPVLVAPVAVRTIPVVVDAVGTVEAYSAVVVRAQVNGEIIAVHFREGQDVKAGQPLFTLDRRATDAAIRKTEATLARLVAVQKNARVNAERYEKLVGDGIVTREQYDSYRTQAESAEAEVTAARAELDNLRVQLSYLTIKAPIAGRTGNLAVDRGNLVKANETAMVTLNQIRPIHVTFAIPERELARVRHYLGKGKVKVEARLAGDSSPPETGVVTFFDNAVDPATATIKLKGTFPNPKSRLWPGQFASVRMTLASLADAVVVPSQAVQTGQKGQYLFVVSGDTAELRPVRIGGTHQELTVVEEGVRPGESVIVDGQMRVVPGGKVSLKQPTDKQGSGGSLEPKRNSEGQEERKTAAPADPAGRAKP
jgi:multidrug efflux system membrane fusion protein